MRVSDLKSAGYRLTLKVDSAKHVSEELRGYRLIAKASQHESTFMSMASTRLVLREAADETARDARRSASRSTFDPLRPAVPVSARDP
jgi:hypothetical protein